MAPPARELVITYGAYSCSPDGNYQVTEDFNSFRVSFSFIVQADTEAGFATAYAAAVAAFRKPFQNLTIVLGGQTLFSLSQTGNSGLEIRPEIVKRDHVANTGRSVRLTVRITGGLPADNVTTDGLREFGVNVAHSPSRRRTVTINGVWTATSGTAARAGYEAGIGTVVDSVKSDLGITDWELVGEPRVESSYNDQTVAFALTYREILYGQVGSGDDSQIVEQNVRISIGKTSVRFAPGRANRLPGGTSDTAAGGQALPLLSVDASFSCFVDFEQTTDLDGVWDRVRPWLVTLMQQAAGGGAFALAECRPTFHRDDNALAATLRGVAVPPGVEVISRTFSSTESDDKGVVLVPAWDDNVYAKFRYRGAGRVLRTTRISEDVVDGGGSSSSGGGGGGSSSGSGSFYGWGWPGNGPAVFPTFGGGSGALTPGAYPFPTFQFSGGSAGASGGSGGAAGGGGAGGAGGGRPSSSAILRDEETTEPTELGLPEGGARINITRRTRTRVEEFFHEVTK